MPLISTRGGLSSRGFGQANGGAGLTLQSVTFPAGSSTFTVPATTNLLISAVGAGADGSPGGTTTSEIGSQITFLNRTTQSFPNGFSATYEGLIEDLNYAVSVFNVGGTVYWTGKRVTVGSNNLCDVSQLFNASRSGIVPNTAYAAFGNNPPTSGPITYNNLPFPYGFNYIVIATQQTTFGPSTGASTTGFGLTFPGGAGGPSTTTTFNNVAVVPNQTYVITNNKSLTITYLA